MKHIVCAADDNYAMPLATLAASIAANRPKQGKLRLFILDCGLSPENQRKIAVAATDAIEAKFIPAASAAAAFSRNITTVQYISQATFARLAIASLLPDDVERIVYLDSDMVVVDDLSELWSLDLQGNLAAAVQDPFNPYVGLVDSKAFAMLGVAAKAPYFNAGVFVIDLAAWRREGIENILKKSVQDFARHVAFADQCLLNLTLRFRILALPPRWNLCVTMLESSMPKHSPYGTKIYEETLASPAIIHYSAGKKPWKATHAVPLEQHFFHYLSQTPWAHYRPQIAGLPQSLNALARKPDLSYLKSLSHRNRFASYLPETRCSRPRAIFNLCLHCLRDPELLIRPFHFLIAAFLQRCFAKDIT